MLLKNLKLFLLIVEKGGLAVAGREMGLSPATVTERLASLEAYYGVQLLTRTTRSIGLTDEGRDLVAGARRVLLETEEIESRLKFGFEKISGTIRLSAPNDFGRNQIVPILGAFMAQNPDVHVDLTLSDSYIDLVDQGIDLALRYGDLPDSSLKSRKLCDNHRIVCASPEYLRHNGAPQHPHDLPNHNCLIMRFGSYTDHDWKFTVNGRDYKQHVGGKHTANDGELIRRWCLAGHGIALKSQWDIKADLEQGALVPLLESYAIEPNALRMVSPPGRTQPKRVRALMDYLLKEFAP